MESENLNPDQSELKELLSLFMVPNKECQDARKDIDTLSRIRQFIIDYEAGHSDLKSTLSQIGDSSSQITYNDNNDPDSRYIRNQYGYIQRNKKSINKNGIYFECLCYLKIIVSNYSICEIISENEWSNLGPSLSSLKQKIDLIISEQNSANGNRDLFKQSSINICQLMDFAKKYHEQLVLRRIIEELNEMKTIDFRSREDRYYFARVFSIIGELINEWLEDRTQMLEFNVKTMQMFAKLRNRFVHKHRRMNKLKQSTNEAINDKIVELKLHLRSIIVNNQSNNNLLQFDYSDASIKVLNELLSQLMKSMFGSSKETQKENSSQVLKMKKNQKNIESNEKIKERLDRSIRRMCEIIEDKNPPSNVNEKLSKMSNENQLKLINENYKKNLQKLSPEDKINFPSILDRSNYEEMKQLVKTCDGKALISSECCDEKPSISSGYSDEKDLISSGYSDDKLAKFRPKMDEANDEIKFLMKFNLSKELDRKTRYIMEYSMLTIGQLIRDIENVNFCQLYTNGVDFHSNKDHLSEFISLTLILEGAKRLKILRNQKIAHNIWLLDDKSFDQALLQIRSVYYIFGLYFAMIMKDAMHDSVHNLYSIGHSLIRFKFYKEAIDYLEKCRIQPTDSPHEAKEEIDKIIKIKTFLWSTLVELSFAYLKIGNKEKSKEIAFYLLEQVNYKEELDIDPSVFHKFLNDLRQIFEVLKDEIDPDAYIELLESFDERYGGCIFSLDIAQFYLQRKNFGKAQEVLKNIIEKSPYRGVKIMALNKYQLIFKDEIHPTPKFENFLYNLEVLIDDDDCDLNLQALPLYIWTRTAHFYGRLALLVNNINLRGMNEAEIIEMRNLSTQFKEILKLLHKVLSLPELVDRFIEYSWLFIVVLSLNIGTDLDLSFMPEVFLSDKLNKYLTKEQPEITPIQKENLATIKKILLHLIHKDEELKHRNPYQMNDRKYLLIKESGECLYKYGELFFIDFHINSSNVAALKLSQTFLRFASKCLSKFIEYWIGQIDPPHDLINYVRIKFCYCLTSLAVLGSDLSLIRKAILYSKNLLENSCNLSKIDVIYLEECKICLEDILDQTLLVLHQILVASNDEFKLNFHDEFVNRYLSNHFQIRINDKGSGKNWIVEETLSFDELKAQIEQHLLIFYKK